jgi:threonyl-tRNA synthetase
MGARIRHAELQKIPYMLIVGEREQASDSVSPRKRKAGDLGATTVDAFADALAAEVARRQ